MSLEKLEAQIIQLKKKHAGMVYQSKGWYALENLIKSKEKTLAKGKQFEFLAR